METNSGSSGLTATRFRRAASKICRLIAITASGGAVGLVILLAGPTAFATAVLPGPSHSTNIALTYDNTRLVVANRDADTVSVIQVRDSQGQDSFSKLAEVPVGIEPHCVAVTPDNQRVFVTNAVDGTVSAVSLVNYRVLATIPVGTEPRGCALTPSGGTLYVANHTSASVSVINTSTYVVTKTIPLGGNPYAVAITNFGHGNDNAETIWVTDFFGRLVPGGPGEGFDTGKRGIVWALPFSNPNSFGVVALSPLTNVGFTADRTDFCPQSSPNPAKLQSTIFCPSTSAPAGSSIITKDPQGCFPNQLYSAVIRGNQLRLSTICAEPEPPLQFTTNIQAVVKAVNVVSLKEITAEDDNINAQIKNEPVPASPTTSLEHLFLGDFAAIDATLDGSIYLLVSRNNDYVVEATVDSNGQLDIHASSTSNSVIRFPTGHIPTGVVISSDNKRAYTNNEVSGTVSVLDLQSPSTTFADIQSSEAPAPGTTDFVVLLGKLVFFTGLGVPNDSSIFSTPLQNINTLANRGKASSNGWSSCASCHPDGLSDHVTWLFPAGPRRSIPLDSTIDKDNPFNTRVLLWSASRDSNVDFNQNSIGVQGGTGFAGTPPDPAIYDHGITEGVPPFDALTTWVQFGARPLLQPASTNPSAVAQGQTIFGSKCASCHGGPKWTKSEILYIDNPAFTSNPNVVAPAIPGTPIDPGISAAGAQIVSLTRSNDSFEKTFKYLENVGTFNPSNPLEIRGQGAAAGQLALGGLGFNVPSLLSIAYHAPYLHDGAAQTIPDVYPLHNLPGGGTIASNLNATQQADLTAFLNTIDGRTALFQSEAEQFKNGD
jgi:YVTN family beta-propeller protein